MDFHKSSKDISTNIMETVNFEFPSDLSFGFGIIEVPLEDSVKFRELLSEPSSSKYGMISLTTSGKIRLVRERLNLPKPERKK